MPEVLWKAYIDFEVEEQEYNRARDLYRRLLERTKHVKVWVSYATFEISIDDIPRARDVYDLAYRNLKNAEGKEERVMLVESWKEFEEKYGDQTTLDEVRKKVPKRIIRRRPIKGPDGSARDFRPQKLNSGQKTDLAERHNKGTDAGLEEYYDYIFPDEQSTAPNLKILEMAHKWKKQKADSE